ncbi:integrase core domain-containing protein [Oceanicoccus sp. KOV_DT_Chl]|uniref:integrase core domain-containing protein n=1 Tax=Oceanicoccus sp. KOV_DT_Chl TaxID=1904639 RepID=UPI00190E8D67|nr:integrase core domain-containing protein [Oceanicoccus sp. KOV_DT_Chl]
MSLLSLWLNPRKLARAAIIIKPSTLQRFHRALIKKKYHFIFSPKIYNKTDPKGPSQELIKVIIEMKRRNPRYGCPRIAQQINLAFGLDINKDIVRRILEKHYKPDPTNQGPSWLTTLGHTKDSLWSIDLFRCESILLKRHWVLVVMDQCTRRTIGFGVHAGPVVGVTLCRLFNEVMSKNNLPTYLSSDNDPLFKYQRWQANLRILDIEEVKSVPYTPISHPFVERLIGSVRRELLDQTFYWNSNDLERKLGEYQRYYNPCRVYTSQNGQTPVKDSEIRPAELKNHGWQSFCRGFFSASDCRLTV